MNRTFYILLIFGLLLINSLKAKPDLIGHDLRPGYPYYMHITPSVITAGDEFTIETYGLKNNGDVGTATNFVVAIYLSNDGEITPHYPEHDPSVDPFLVDGVIYNLDASNPDRDILIGLDGITSLEAGWISAVTPSTYKMPTSSQLRELGWDGEMTVGIVIDPVSISKPSGDIIEDYEDPGSGVHNDPNNYNQAIDKDKATFIVNLLYPEIEVLEAEGVMNDLNINFGDVFVDGSRLSHSQRTFSIINSGDDPLVISDITVGGSGDDYPLVNVFNNTGFSITSYPIIIYPGISNAVIFAVNFDPLYIGPSNAQYLIHTNDPDEAIVTLNLSGNGIGFPQISLERDSGESTDPLLDFGLVYNDGAGGILSIQNAVIKNIGDADLVINQNGLSVSDTINYKIKSVTDAGGGTVDLSNSSVTLAAGTSQELNVEVEFDPLNNGSLDASFDVSYINRDGNSEVESATISGVSNGPPVIVITDVDEQSNISSIEFMDTHADGVGLVKDSVVLKIKNTGASDLVIPEGSIASLLEPDFVIESIVSSIDGTINIGVPSQLTSISKGGIEFWLVTVSFDPSSTGSLSSHINIGSEITIPVSGSGISTKALDVNQLDLDFGKALNDGIGLQMKEMKIELKNIGTQDLVINQNGLFFVSGSSFNLIEIESSVDGIIDIGSPLGSHRTISGLQTEVWTVTIAFDPVEEIQYNDFLRIMSDDPVNSQLDVSVSGSGEVPMITLNSPSADLNISNESVFRIDWTDSYEANDATISLYLDDDTDSSIGLIPIVNPLSKNDAQGQYDWRPDDLTLVGNTFYLYAKISDGTVVNSDYSNYRITIDPAGAFKLISATMTKASEYNYEYEYMGQLYMGTATLPLGENVLTIETIIGGGQTAVHQFDVSRVNNFQDVHSVSYENGMNRVQTITNANGVNITIFYDNLGRIEKTLASNGAMVEYTYDAANRRTIMSDSTGYTFYEYDELDRLTHFIKSKNNQKGDGDDLLLRYVYDDANRVSDMHYPSGEHVHYKYDGAGRLTEANNVNRNLNTTYVYHSDSGLLNYVDRANGVKTTYDYDSLGRLDYVEHRKIAGNALIVRYDYSLNPLGFADSLIITTPSDVKKEWYQYDALDRIEVVTYSGDDQIDMINGVLDGNDLRETYTYDGVGNRITKLKVNSNGTIESLSYFYGDENRLEQVVDQITGSIIAKYKYDPAGNRKQKITASGSTLYTWDERNLLTSVSTPTDYVSYRYDGEGMAVYKRVNDDEYDILNDPNGDVHRAIEIRSITSSENVLMTYGVDEISRYDSSQGANLFRLNNRIGTASHVLDLNAGIVSEKQFDVYGNLISY